LIVSAILLRDSFHTPKWSSSVVFDVLFVLFINITFSVKRLDLNVVQLKKHLDDLQASAGDSQSAVSRLQQENSALDEEKRNLRNSLLSEQGKRQQLAEDLAKVSTAAGLRNSPSFI